MFHKNLSTCVLACMLRLDSLLGYNNPQHRSMPIGQIKIYHFDEFFSEILILFQQIAY